MKEAGLWTFFVVALLIVGWSAWRILTTATPSYSGPPAGSGLDLPHQLTVEAGQARSIALEETQVALDLTQIAVTNPSPTPKPTMRPTATQQPYTGLPACSLFTEEDYGKPCKLDNWTPTPAPPKPTRAPCYDTPSQQYTEPACIWQPTPTPWNPLEGK